MTDPTGPSRPGWGRPSVSQIGATGILVMVLAHLVWDPALTLLGVAEFGIGEEDTDLVRSMLRIHPGVWLAAKLVFVGGGAVVMHRLGIHRDAETAWVPWFVAIPGVLGPLGWLELLLAG